MHVALFSPAWPAAGRANGIVTYVHWMREALLAQGHRVSIFAVDVAIPERGVHRLRMPLSFRMQWRWRQWRGRGHASVLDWGIVCAANVLSVHRRDPIDVVEMEESFGWFADVERLTGIATVVKLHGPAFLSLIGAEAESALARERNRREGAALRGARTIISPTRHTLDATVERFELRPAIARHVVNPIALAPGAPRWDATQCDPKGLLFVGRFDTRKGGDVVVRAFAQLLAEQPSLKLVMVGPEGTVEQADGRAMRFAEFRDAHLPGAADRIDYRGPLAPNEILPLRTGALVTMLASRWENQSYALLEAMLQGCPVVASDAGGQRESVRHGETGLLFPVGDAAALAAALRSLLHDPSRATALGANARRQVDECHRPERVAKETLAVYEEAIAAPWSTPTRTAPSHRVLT